MLVGGGNPQQASEVLEWVGAKRALTNMLELPKPSQRFPPKLLLSFHQQLEHTVFEMVSTLAAAWSETIGELRGTKQPVFKTNLLIPCFSCLSATWCPENRLQRCTSEAPLHTGPGRPTSSRTFCPTQTFNPFWWGIQLRAASNKRIGRGLEDGRNLSCSLRLLGRMAWLGMGPGLSGGSLICTT